METSHEYPVSNPSPSPSIADSSSSGCESAFSFPNSIRAPSRDPSPSIDVLGETAHIQSIKKKKKRKKSPGSPYHSLDSKSSPKIRLKSDNWEWHSRAKILAAEFIKENYEMNELRI